MKSPAAIGRRRFIALAGGLVTLRPAVSAVSSPPTGWVEPRLQPPAVEVIDSGGRRQALSSLLGGPVTALQLMFTGCSATCPAQGALFAAVAGRIGADTARLLSVSIDALGDTPASMAAWQARFGRHPGWQAAVSSADSTDRLCDYVTGVPGHRGTHTAQVFVFDAQGRLCYRTGDAPESRWLAALLDHVARRG